MTGKTITLISTDGHNAEIPGELVHKYSRSFEVKLSPGVTTNTFYKADWKIKPTPAPLPTEPGSIIRATIRGVPGSVAILSTKDVWVTAETLAGGTFHTDSNVDLDTVEIGRVTFGDES